MAHTKPITSDWWYDEAPGDEGPFPGYHTTTRDPPAEIEPEGVFDWIKWGAEFIRDPVGVLLGTQEDWLPLVGAAGEIIEYLTPDPGVTSSTIPPPEEGGIPELEEYTVYGNEEPPVLEESGTRGWDWQWGWLDDAYDVGRYIWNRAWEPAGPEPPPTLETETETTPNTSTMETSTVPTTGYPEIGDVPAACAPGGRRFSPARARSILLKRGAYAIGQCSLKYSSFKWLVVHTGLGNAMRTLALSEREVNFLLLNPVKRRGRGITAANIRTVNRTMSKLDSLTRRLNCACGTKKTYKRKKTCR